MKTDMKRRRVKIINSAKLFLISVWIEFKCSIWNRTLNFRRKTIQISKHNSLWFKANANRHQPWEPKLKSYDIIVKKTRGISEAYINYLTILTVDLCKWEKNWLSKQRQYTCVSSKQSQKCVTLLKWRTELNFFLLQFLDFWTPIGAMLPYRSTPCYLGFFSKLWTAINPKP